MSTFAECDTKKPQWRDDPVTVSAVRKSLEIRTQLQAEHENVFSIIFVQELVR